MDQLNDSQIKELAKSLTSKEAAQEILHNFLPLLHTRLQSSNTGLRHRRIDLLSRALLPSDFKQWLPIETSGDGSCLYNAVSLSLVGDESLSALLRMLTVSELFANAEFYANHPQIKEFASASGYTNSAIISIFLSEQKSLATYNGDCSKVVQAIQVLAQETAEPSVYSRQFHILSLASVVGKPIFAAYPDIQSAWAIKLACHGYFYPRDVFASDVNPETLKNDAIFVMWTRTNRIPLLGWEPNHFVLLKEANSIPLTKSYAQVVASGKPNIAAYSTFPSKQTTGNTTYATPSKKQLHPTCLCGRIQPTPLLPHPPSRSQQTLHLPKSTLNLPRHLPGRIRQTLQLPKIKPHPPHPLPGESQQTPLLPKKGPTRPPPHLTGRNRQTPHLTKSTLRPPHLPGRSQQTSHLPKSTLNLPRHLPGRNRQTLQLPKIKPHPPHPLPGESQQTPLLPKKGPSCPPPHLTGRNRQTPHLTKSTLRPPHLPGRSQQTSHLPKSTLNLPRHLPGRIRHTLHLPKSKPHPPHLPRRPQQIPSLPRSALHPTHLPGRNRQAPLLQKRKQTVIVKNYTLEFTPPHE